MRTEIQTNTAMHALERVLINGDLTALNPQERVLYFNKVCESVGLNPFTKPFEYITFQGKTILYATKSCTEQLRNINGISIKSVTNQLMDGIYVVTAQAVDKNGREDVSTGAINIAGLKGDALANAFMKAETKAKRRVTLSISGLAFLDESEIETLPKGQQPANIYSTTVDVSNQTLPDMSVKPIILFNSWTNEEMPIMPQVMAEWLNAKLKQTNTENEMATLEQFLKANKTPLTRWTNSSKDNKADWLAFHSGLSEKRKYFADQNMLEAEERKEELKEKYAEEVEPEVEMAGDSEYQDAIRC